LFTLNRNDYKGWARGLRAAGYATNPRYADLLIDLIERYELYKYDRTETYAQKEIREHKVEAVIEIKEEQEPAVKTEEIKAPVKMVIHEVKASDTLYAISRQYNVTIAQLKQLNGLLDDNLSIGQLLVITK
jgi:LysM repeat protein